MINAKQTQKPHRILVVDDQELNRDILGMILEEYYEVDYACDGAEALEKIEAYEDGDLSLVMLDLIMPRMDGFEVLRRMKADEHLKGIPVIVLTADKSAELKALQMGAADFITKPFDIHEIILARAGRIIELSEGRQLISSAEHDRLTGLYNRNFFYEYAERLYVYHKQLHLDAVFLDVEQFHLLNETSGREFGDEVLRVIGSEIRTFLSGSEGIACRFDADQFEIYCAHQDGYRELLDRVQESLDRLSASVSIRLRMGVYLREEGVEPVLMFDRARAACNHARGDYQNPYVVYDESMRNREMLNQRLLNDFRKAVDERQLCVFYQPKYDIRTEPARLTSAEALIRWKHPELGMISPGVFVPLFEANGLISAVDAFVWKEAAGQIAKWKETYGVSVPVSVNLSRADVFDPQLVDNLVNLIERNGLRFRDLKLEVTESAYTDNAKQLLDVVSRLRGLGFEIEMDDFGSGYSSLNMLSSMPIDVLKMDMKFVRDIERSETDLRLVELILDIAKYLGVPVVAEGVETEGQLRILRNAGCQIVQGYYFSKPLPAEEFEKRIEQDLELAKEEKS